MAGFGNFAAGFLQAFGAAKHRKQDKQEQDDEKKARLKLAEVALAREQRLLEQMNESDRARVQQEKSRQDLLSTIKQHVSGVQTQALPGTGVQLGDVAATQAGPAPMGLAAALAQPDVFLKSLEAGVPLPQQPEAPNEIRVLEALAANPQLAALKAMLNQAGASQTRIDLGSQGLTKPPQGFYRPVPDKPGLAPEPGAVSVGQEALDKQFGQDAATWVAGGGFADTQKSIVQLEEARKALDAVVKSGKEGKLTGPVVANTPQLIRQIANPASLIVRDTVEEIVQRNLRLVLGAQFTAEEGERLIARSYNEALPEKENAKRVGRLIKQIGDAAKAKQEAVDYFNEHGTLAGFKGKVWTLADFDPEGDSESNENVVDWNDLD